MAKGNKPLVNCFMNSQCGHNLAMMATWPGNNSVARLQEKFKFLGYILRSALRNIGMM